MYHSIVEYAKQWTERLSGRQKCGAKRQDDKDAEKKAKKTTGKVPTEKAGKPTEKAGKPTEKSGKRTMPMLHGWNHIATVPSRILL